MSHFSFDSVVVIGNQQSTDQLDRCRPRPNYCLHKTASRTTEYFGIEQGMKCQNWVVVKDQEPKPNELFPKWAARHPISIGAQAQPVDLVLGRPK